MRYVGSKARLAKRIAEHLPEAEWYLEPFLGGANSFAVIAPRYPKSVAGEFHEDIAAMWSAVHGGWLPPENVSETEYRQLKDAPPSALRGFVGSGGSFGGKWFGGYARGGFNADGTPRNHQAESARAVAKKAPAIRASVGVWHRSYEEWSPPAGCVVYCDPPYAGTLGYNAGLDHGEFWQTARRWAADGAHVFVSEYTAPDDIECVAEFSHRQSVALSGDRKTTVERLFRV